MGNAIENRSEFWYFLSTFAVFFVRYTAKIWQRYRKDQAKTPQRSRKDIIKILQRHRKLHHKNTAPPPTQIWQRHRKGQAKLLQRHRKDLAKTLQRHRKDLAKTLQRSRKDIAKTPQNTPKTPPGEKTPHKDSANTVPFRPIGRCETIWTH